VRLPRRRRAFIDRGAATQRQPAGPPPSGVFAYYSSGSDDGDEDEEEDKDDEFADRDVVGREVRRRREGSRISDVSDDNAGEGAAAMTEDETPRFSNVRHRSRRDDDDSPAAAVSSACIPPPTTMRTSAARNSNARHRTN
jgi:hypothetical protein